jgi:predicted nucleic acid-binding protein
MSQVFIDSSVWVDYFRGIESSTTATLDEILGRSEAVIGDLVLLEILQGYRLLRELHAAEAALAEVHCVDLVGSVRARQAAANYRYLRSVGITPRTTVDVLIASYCASEGLDLLADDRDFTLMAPHLGLNLLSPPLN